MLSWRLALGLSIAKHLVELHGETIQAASAGVGGGVTCQVQLPARTGASSNAPLQAGGSVQSPA